MAENTIKARIQSKNDTEERWLLSSFKPKKGEIVVYNPDENYLFPRLKIGDGINSINNLSFMAG